MGMSLTADIMYGMVLHDGEETVVNVPWRKSGDDEDEDNEEDFEDWVVAQLGLAPLDWSTYPEERYDYHSKESYDAYSARMKVLSDAWSERVGSKAYYAKKEELLDTVPVEEAWGGIEGYHTIILRLKGSPKVEAYYAAAFDPMALEVPDDSAAIAFLEPFGVKWVGSWLLVPSYG